MKHPHTHNIYFITILITICISYLLSKYCIQFTLVQGDSMLPSYHNWELVITEKFTKHYSYGDVIVFSNTNVNATLVKRIVALPGDSVQIDNGILYVNNIPSSIQFKDTLIEDAGIAATPITLTSNEYFVLGDNYNVSKDSRYASIGCIQKSAIIGKVIFPHNS